MPDIARDDEIGGYRSVRERVLLAATSSGRRGDDVVLIAVSKTVAAERLRPVLEAGQVSFGENRVQEAKGKWPDLKRSYPRTELHLIGPLQTNKVRDALQIFDCIHTLDRPRLAEALAAEFAKSDRQVPLFVQVNTGEEPQKAGILPAEADAFIATCRDLHKLPVVGLMCIPPVGEEAALHFALLAKIARRNGLAKLSMGMSHDMETAIALGATHVRVGTAIFGERTPPAG